MKKFMTIILSVMIMGFMLPASAQCESMSNDAIVEELKALKERINRLEGELEIKDQEIETLKAQTVKRDEMADVIEEMKSEEGPLAGIMDGIMDKINISGLIEFGGARESVDNRNGTDTSQSDLCLTTAELTVEAEVNEWVNVATTLLYEDATFGDETSIDLDVGTLSIGNTEKFPLYFTGGALYVPFGALLTHFPDDPIIDQPLTLVLGETR
ncbi:MAG: LbtU family siderophore porin, partial [Deltaproteobacteria bacterium]|nr:LbtU family siderophore porin [Deltaproteobacteria bacterium]